MSAQNLDIFLEYLCTAKFQPKCGWQAVDTTRQISFQLNYNEIQTHTHADRKHISYAPFHAQNHNDDVQHWTKTRQSSNFIALGMRSPDDTANTRLFCTIIRSVHPFHTHVTQICYCIMYFMHAHKPVHSLTRGTFIRLKCGMFGAYVCISMCNILVYTICSVRSTGYVADSVRNIIATILCFLFCNLNAQKIVVRKLLGWQCWMRIIKARYKYCLYRLIKQCTH